MSGICWFFHCVVLEQQNIRQLTLFVINDGAGKSFNASTWDFLDNIVQSNGQEGYQSFKFLT